MGNDFPSPTAATVEEFMRLFAAHQLQIFQFILALLPSLQDAEDALQETNLVLWRKFSQYQRGTSFLAWGTRVAHLEVLKSREKASRRAVLLDEVVLDQLAAEQLANSHHLDGVRDALQNCLGKLRPTDRELISRRYAAGTSGKGLAEELGRPQNSIYKSLGRVRGMLLGCIESAMSGGGAIPGAPL